jgi:serine phosphatase RsbU (regulator of sigma subunit)/CHASE3 domain sensor protein/anti-sigma regulatory factor (Ser/Thr protein kinase)
MNPHRTGLRRWTLLSGAVLVVAVALVISLLLATVQDLRDAQRLALGSDRTLQQAAANEKLLIDMETGLRGYVITHEEDFLEPFRAALRKIPVAAHRLERLTADDPGQLGRARAVDGAIGAYAADYAIPLIRTARRDPQAARGVAATRAGKRRVDEARTQIAALESVETARSAARREHADTVGRRAVIEAAVGLLGLVLLVTFVTRYLRRALASEERAALEASLAQARLGVLARASEILSESLDYEATLEQVAHVVVPVMADWCSVELAASGGAPRNVVVAHVDPAKVEFAREISVRYPPREDAASGAPQVMRTGEAELYEELPEELLIEGAQDEEHLRLIRELGLVSAMVVPLTARDRTFGAMTLVSAESGRRYGPDDLAYAEDLGRRAAIAIDNARLYDQQRGVSETLQRSLLPESLPVIPRAALAARYRPAEVGSEVGGDWYDVLTLPDARVVIAIGDVVGHGVRAAAIMGQLRSALRAYALEGHGPGESLDRLKAMVRTTSGAGMIGTVLMGLYDPASGSLRYASAGHPPPIVRTPDGEVEFLNDGRGTPLAVGVQAAEEGTATLEPGALLLLYTDGLVERRSERLGAGLERLERAVREGPAEADALVDHVLAALAEEGPSADDVALLAISPVHDRAAPIRIELPADRSAVTSARRAGARWLTGAGANDMELYELSVALGDACANAVEHAYGPGDATFEIGAELVDGEVIIEVRDAGRWRTPRGVNRGRGLRLMDAFTDSLEIEKRDSGTHVRMRRRLASGEE